VGATIGIDQKVVIAAKNNGDFPQRNYQHAEVQAIMDAISEIVQSHLAGKKITLYSTLDIGRLIETDNAHGRLSGPATKRILQREYLVYEKSNYERISHISVPHIYNIRKQSRQYKSNVLFIAHTQATARNIGERRKPQPNGMPGHLRVDSVHQGDKDLEKGVYYINLVDEVTQWEIIGCSEGISEQFLIPLLEELLARFPFVILGFHSDNGSEYINHVVAKLLRKLLIEQTKSRSRRTNDNS